MLAIYKKELKTYFTSILGYAVIGVYLLLGIILFNGYFLGVKNTNDFSGFFGDMNTALLFILPLLCIRILAEDKKFGTYELLLTSPVTSTEIILGKYLAVLTFVIIGISLTLFFAVFIAFFTPVDWGIIFSQYLGLVFTAAFFLAIGMFASSIASNYVVVGIVTFAIFIFLFILSSLIKSIDLQQFNFLKDFSFLVHYQAFANGLIEIKNIVYFLCGIIFWLYLAKISIEVYLWKD
jgi:ABC-2 type transport system permease protein